MIKPIRSVFEQVEEFNKEVLGIAPRPLGKASEEEFKLSIIQLNEEIGEFEEAYAAGDIGEMADAMVDLIYFACGVAYKQGITHSAMNALFAEVHNANMLKAAGKKEGRGYDGDAVDAAKPKDWVAPDANLIIKRHDYHLVDINIMKTSGNFIAGDLLTNVSVYPDGTHMLLIEHYPFLSKDILMWAPDDISGEYSINDSECFRVSYE